MMEQEEQRTKVGTCVFCFGTMHDGVGAAAAEQLLPLPLPRTRFLLRWLQCTTDLVRRMGRERGRRDVQLVRTMVGLGEVCWLRSRRTVAYGSSHCGCTAPRTEVCEMRHNQGSAVLKALEARTHTRVALIAHHGKCFVVCGVVLPPCGNVEGAAREQCPDDGRCGVRLEVRTIVSRGVVGGGGRLEHESWPSAIQPWSSLNTTLVLLHPQHSSKIIW